MIDSEKTEYGFYTAEYEDGKTCETLMTGDGKSAFSELIFDNGLVGIGFSYGEGEGGGKESTKASDIGVRFQVKFESKDSIDSMINILNKAKKQLAENQIVREAIKTPGLFIQGDTYQGDDK